MTEPSGNEIAIIGMAGAFPGAPDLATYWRNLRAGVESISLFDDPEPSPLVPDQRSLPGFVPAGGVLDGADLFDHDLFGIAPREARWMDPQQRVFLQLAWAALEDAGYDPARYAGRISVYAGAGNSGHLLAVLGQADVDPASLYEAVSGASADNLATRVSYLLRLRGESMNVFTACSTGLVAVHMACQSLLLGQSAVALAGAVSISVPQRTGYVHQDGMILSPDGHCRAFDHRAGGTVPGYGAGVVVLKPLADAVDAGDPIHAVLLGSAINNEGHRSVGYTAPSVEAQAEVVAEALAFAGAGGDDIGYVEAHGTGTPLGDPIEIAALTKAFRRSTARVADCPIGSVKTNIGHLDTAAGIAGLIKVALMLRYREIPPSLHLERPNPAIDFAASPFVVNTRLRPWTGRRLAGVSSFGIGGTNVHAVLAEAPGRQPAAPSDRPHQLVTLAAHTPTALRAMASELAAWLSRGEAGAVPRSGPDGDTRPGTDGTRPGTCNSRTETCNSRTETDDTRTEMDDTPGGLGDLAFTRAVGRAELRFRRAVVAADVRELVAGLRDPGGDEPAVAGEPRVVLLFPGQGAARHGMAGELYRAEGAFRAELDGCVPELERWLGRPLRPCLLAGDGPVEDVELAHAGLFAVEFALARLWLRWGVRPAALIGHSFGEYAAAAVAGVLTLADAAELAVLRGRLMAAVPEGAMVAVGLDEREVEPYLTPGLSIAAVNGDQRCVVSGPVEAVAALRERLAGDGHSTVPLPVRRAFHSAAVDPVRAELATAFDGRALGAPELPLVSSLTGDWWGEPGPDYWARQLREPVRFREALETVAEPGGPLVLVEAGPDQALTGLARAQLRGRATVVPSLRRRTGGGSDHRVLLSALGALWRRGVRVDWDAFYAGERRRRVELPTYPFEGRDCRLAPAAPLPRAPAALAGAGKVAELAEAAGVPVAGEGGRADGPRDELERRVFEVWAERLGTSDFGIHDDFLELGGNSLVAAQLITRLRSEFSVRLPLSALFEAPTVAGTAEHLRTALDGRSAAPEPAGERPAAEPSGGAAAAPDVLPPIRRRRGAQAPLSVVQARTLALDEADPGNPALVMPMAIELTGRLDIGALAAAVTQVVARHESLRATFHRDRDGWTQRIDAGRPVTLDVEDVPGTEAAEQLARQEAQRPFDLAVAPLRLRLLRLAEDRHVLLVTVHHVVCDTISLVNLAREIAAGYGAAVQGRPFPLPPLAVQYPDFAAWQRDLLRGGALRRQRQHWLRRLAQLPPRLALPTDRPRASEHGVRGRQVPLELPAQLSARVVDLGRRLGATTFSTLLAAYAALLSRIAGADDIVVCTPIGNRDHAELEPLIGYVAHALPLRVSVAGDPSYAELVGRAQQALLDAYAHPDLPYEELVAQTQPALDAGRSRIFDAMFVVHSGIPPQQRLPGMVWRRWEVPDMPAMFGATLATLSLMLAESPDGLTGNLEYAQELFDPASARRITGQFVNLVADAAARPEARISELVLDPAPAVPQPTVTPPELATAVATVPPERRGPGPVQFSLSYFADDEDDEGTAAGTKYELLLDGVRLADELGLAAVWTPERHFHSFGGLYPNPTATSAALATASRRIGIRAGSVVLPLHDPIRVAEDWAVIDNLSGGRAGVSFASGWHPDDFVLAPDRFAQRRELMRDGIDVVRRLWRGETVRRRNGVGTEVEIAIRPRPVQPELPFWITAASSPDTFRLAGELGGFVLTNLMAQSLDELAANIAGYHRAWRDAGHQGAPHVTLMLHAFLAEDTEHALAAVREPLLRYFRSSVGIARGFLVGQGLDLRPEDLSEDDVRSLVEHGIERYLHDGGLFGTPQDCVAMVDKVRELGVDEIAALVDYGVPAGPTLRSIERLAELADRERARAAAAAGAAQRERITTVAAPAGARVVDALGRPLGVGVVGELDSAELRGSTPRSAELRGSTPRSAELRGSTPRSGEPAGQRARWRADGLLELLPAAPRPMPPAPRAASPAGTIVPVGRDRPLPLSFAQQRLWYLDQLVPGNVAYNNTVALRMRGELDRSALHRALQEVVRRHEVLRTTIDTAATGDSEAVQVIKPAVEIELPVRDLGPADVDRVARDFARTPFDLGRGPLLRACLLRVAADEHVLLVGMHHIVSDGWSAGVLLGELAALYAAFVAGEPSPLPPLAVQYADYAVWQRARQDGEAIAGDLAYWKQTLADVPMLELPTDRRRAAVQGQSGAREPVRIDGALTERLRRLCRETGVTTYMALHAALVALLHRYSGQTDLAIGTAVAGRNQPETEQLVGCFINTVVVRTDLAGDPTLRELLGRVKAAVLGAVAHQELQFERLVDELRVPRALSHAPLVQAMFVLHNTPSPRVRLGELTLEAIDIDSGTAKLDLVLELREEDGAIAGAWEYNTDLFDAETIRRLTGHLLALLTAATASPDRTVSSLGTLDGPERDRVLALSAGPELPENAEPAATTVVAAFEAQAARTPRAPAVADTEQTVTFGELDERANAIAHGLRDIGVGPGERVAVLVGRPVEAITAMLGVLKAGGAYVPVDANAPPARRRALIEQAGARAVTDWAALAAGRPATRPEQLAGPTDPAYVIFTSGSTGRPKGVVVEHGQLLWSTRARRAHYGPPGACLNLYALTFDGSVAWIWFALLAGGAVWCPPPGLVAEPSHLAEFVATHRLARIATVPALYGQLLAAAAPGQLRSLRSVTVGGESCPPELVRTHSSALPGVELHNEYGPTEATVWSTVWSSTPDDQPPFEATVPIGRPIPGGRSYVLDAHGALLPAGAAGELYVGGPAVARGYLDDPEQTRQRFRPDPFGRNGERVYRTGDRARWNRHGQLEFLGRTDRQLKVRGFRVEPAEIEAVLAAHPAIAEAVVIGATVDGSPNRLAGYVVPAAGAAVDPDELTGFARSRLPGHLVPARLVTLSELPRTRHGKLDVRALPAAEPPPAVAPVAPRTELERTLAAAVADTLRRDSVGVHDDFFELGGDSILAMSVVNRARQRGVELAVRQLFEHPTVARLAAVAKTAGSPAPGSAGTIAGPVPLSPIQRWFFELDLPRPDHFNLSVQLELSMRPRPDVLRDALRAVLDHHAALRLRFSRRGGQWSQEVRGASSDPALETTRGPVDLAALDQRLQESLDLENGPLLRAALVQCGPQLPDRLLLVAHHLVVDAVSLRILLTDLFTAYGQLAAGRPAQLPRGPAGPPPPRGRGGRGPGGRAPRRPPPPIGRAGSRSSPAATRAERSSTSGRASRTTSRRGCPGTATARTSSRPRTSSGSSSTSATRAPCSPGQGASTCTPRWSVRSPARSPAGPAGATSSSTSSGTAGRSWSRAWTSRGPWAGSATSTRSCWPFPAPVCCRPSPSSCAGCRGAAPATCRCGTRPAARCRPCPGRRLP